MALKNVLLPIQIGPKTIKNRVVRTAHGTNLDGGKIKDRFIAYHETRARGGVGLTILEVLAVHRTAPGRLNAFDPDLPDGYRRLMEAVRPHGMSVFQQLWHSGNSGRVLDEGAPWAPSDMPNPLGGDVPIPMTKAMIDEIVGAYADAASMCRDSGLDGVEIHSAHGYLIQQFISPNTNKRTDEYGGSLENRSRFLIEVLKAVRAAVADDIAVGVRLSPDKTIGGVSVEDNQAIVKMLENESLADYINVSLGNYNSFPLMIGGMHEPVGYELPTSAPVTACATVPSLVTGRIRTLEEADEIIRSGQAELVGMTRALIADPFLVAKTIDNRPEDVRPCIACNQGCVGRTLRGGAEHLRCTVNPGTGFETVYGDQNIQRSDTPKKVLIIGGGPAGLEAARVAALRGHSVTLAEATKDLGGMVNLSAKAPRRYGIRDIIQWFEETIFKLGVDVRLSTYIEADDILAEAPDAVIIATGSTPRMDGVQSSNPGEPALGMDGPNVFSSDEIMSGQQNFTGKRALVVDDCGHFEAVAVALSLIEKGASVTFATPFKSFAPKMETALQTEPALEFLYGGDFNLLTQHRLLEIKPGEARLATTFKGREITVPADLTVFVSANRPNRELYDALAGTSIDVKIVGDANSPRFMETAIREGQLAAFAV